MNTHTAPTLADLYADLDRATRNLLCADMIDDFDRRKREKARWSGCVSALKAQIARIEESF